MPDTESIPTATFGHTTVYYGEKSGKYPDGNQVIVTGKDTRIAFDSPLVANRVGAPFDDADLIVQGHVHEDHITGWHRVRGRAVYVHDADLDAARSWDGLARAYGIATQRLPAMRAKIERQFFYEPRPDAIGFTDGASWDLGGGVRVSAAHLPGHTAGHCALLVEPDGVAFIGDIDLTGFGPYYGDASSELGAFRESLRKLPSLPATTWITSHHRGVYTERERMLGALAAFTAKIDERSERLLALLRESPRTLDELVRIRLLYPPGYEEVWIDDAERRSIAMHLDELCNADRVACDGDGRYRPR